MSCEHSRIEGASCLDCQALPWELTLDLRAQVCRLKDELRTAREEGRRAGLEEAHHAVKNALSLRLADAAVRALLDARGAGK